MESSRKSVKPRNSVPVSIKRLLFKDSTLRKKKTPESAKQEMIGSMIID